MSQTSNSYETILREFVLRARSRPNQVQMEALIHELSDVKFEREWRCHSCSKWTAGDAFKIIIPRDPTPVIVCSILCVSTYAESKLPPMI